MIVADKIGSIELGLKGDYQIENASTAIAILNELKIPEESIYNGLKVVKWPGRFEFKEGMLFDCAHNPDGIRALITSISKLDYKKLIVVFDVMRDKDYELMSKLINKLDAKFILTKVNVSRAKDPSGLKEYFDNYEIIYDVKEAVKYAKSLADENDLVIVAGSIFLVGEAYSFLNHLTPK